jgi:flagellar FliL protein
MAAEAEVSDAKASGGGKSKLLIIIGAGLAVLLLAGGGLFFFMSSSSAPADAAHGATDAHGAAEVHHEPTFIFNLEPMTVNLSSEDGAAAYLRMSIALEVASEEVMHEVQPNLAKIVDAFQVYLRELRRSDLEGSAGIYRLKEELTRRINVAIYPQRVQSVLFRELLVQ